MQIPSYIELSNHHIYYLRFPIPKSLHPQNKASDVRLSLGTREPKEALQLSRLLVYSGEQLLRNAGLQIMDYQDIRAVLQENFKALRDKKKEQILKYGQLSEAEKTALANQMARATQALEINDFSFIENELTAFIENNELSIQSKSKEYALLQREYLKAVRDYPINALKYNQKFDSFDFGTEPTPENLLRRKYELQRKTTKKLAELIDTYSAEKLRLNEWREHIAKDYRTQFSVLLRYVGEDSPVHLSLDVAEDVKQMLIRMPKNSNKKADYKGLTIEEIMALDIPKQERLSPVTISKHIRTDLLPLNWSTCI